MGQEVERERGECLQSGHNTGIQEGRIRTGGKEE